MAIANDLHKVAIYAGDFSVEMQNLLVGDLFGSTAEHRRPIDPSSKVITLENAQTLERYFLEETHWGHWIAEEEAKAAARFNVSPTGN